MPSIRVLIEQTADAILLLFVICAGCALTWTPKLLAALNVTSTDATLAYRSYCDLFIILLDALSPPLAPSTVALKGLLLVTHVLSNTDSHLDQVYALRGRVLWINRTL